MSEYSLLSFGSSQPDAPDTSDVTTPVAPTETAAASEQVTAVASTSNGTADTTAAVEAEVPEERSFGRSLIHSLSPFHYPQTTVCVKADGMRFDIYKNVIEQDSKYFKEVFRGSETVHALEDTDPRALVEYIHLLHRKYYNKDLESYGLSSLVLVPGGARLSAVHTLATLYKLCCKVQNTSLAEECYDALEALEREVTLDWTTDQAIRDTMELVQLISSHWVQLDWPEGQSRIVAKFCKTCPTGVLETLIDTMDSQFRRAVILEFSKLRVQLEAEPTGTSEEAPVRDFDTLADTPDSRLSGCSQEKAPVCDLDTPAAQAGEPNKPSSSGGSLDLGPVVIPLIVDGRGSLGGRGGRGGRKLRFEEELILDQELSLTEDSISDQTMTRDQETVQEDSSSDQELVHDNSSLDQESAHEDDGWPPLPVPVVKLTIYYREAFYGH
ncbi:Uu.00g009610.m01.CDS01 [Anthostomella pinea]|uniref:Uu.00g009610.m01.CDS01 n=1 Tax=Anthostomella pinea TaxID=933095 RepID=A0AAI8YMM2_9PEZI|nr:Uu.00g009610.m01.CDS01 [Anthostomella pinea]